jgi:hypothetical protein
MAHVLLFFIICVIHLFLQNVCRSGHVESGVSIYKQRMTDYKTLITCLTRNCCIVRNAALLRIMKGHIFILLKQTSPNCL